MAQRISETLGRSRTKTSYALHRRVLSNRASRRSFRASEPDLSDVQSQILARLSEDGIAFTTFAELIGNEQLWRSLSQDVESFAQECEQRVRDAAGREAKTTKETYLLRRHRHADPTFMANDPWLRYALSSQVLDIVNAYLGMWSKVRVVDQWYTLPSEDEGRKRISSQRWHRDQTDRNHIKVFTYFSDVDEGAGPLEYMCGSATGGPYYDVWPWKPLSGQDPPQDDWLEERVPRSQRVTATGLRGTIVLCDTNGFHRGGFATTKPRLSSMSNYVSPAALSTLSTRRFLVEWDSTVDELPEPAQFAID